MSLEKSQPFELFLLLELHKTISERKIAKLESKEEQIYKLVKKYYQEKTGEVLDETIPENRTILYNWLKENTRYETINELIKLTINRLITKESKDEVTEDNIDYFISNNLKVLIDLMIHQARTSIELFGNSQIV